MESLSPLRIFTRLTMCDGASPRCNNVATQHVATTNACQLDVTRRNLEPCVPAGRDARGRAARDLPAHVHRKGVERARLLLRTVSTRSTLTASTRSTPLLDLIASATTRSTQASASCVDVCSPAQCSECHSVDRPAVPRCAAVASLDQPGPAASRGRRLPLRARERWRWRVGTLHPAEGARSGTACTRW
jgi:hypothetical protein